MPLDRKSAEEILTAFNTAYRLCNDSVRVVMTNDGFGVAMVFGGLAAEFMGNTVAIIEMPIWQAFPDLKPPEMNEPYIKTKPVLSSESQEAMRVFLTAAHAALKRAEDTIPTDEQAHLSPCGGLSEVKQAATAIEEFLASPRHRDQK